jgi:phage shock protein C
MNRRLYRSRNQRMLAGVCGGIAEYFNIDVTIVRLIWAILSLSTFGSGLLIYIISAIIIPERPFGYQDNEPFANGDGFPPVDKAKAMSILGLVLIVVGILALISGLFPVLWRIIRHGFWPAIIIIIGIMQIHSSWKNSGNR